ncbi:MAG: Lrp/AsnC family transcriptional regulator [Asgard group archaeon]|nr:Lrp/AsnC family transcriptional regulator [Asgard group archaeon]
MLDAKDIQILLTLQNNPLATISDIAEQIKMSVSGTASRIERLVDEKKAYHRVHADLNLEALGLEIHDYFYEVNSKKHLAALEKELSHNHPYLLARFRCYGRFSGLYMQFRIPENSIHHLEILTDELVSNGLLNEYQHLKRIEDEKVVRIKSSLRSFNPTENSWVFNWDKWRTDFKKVSTKQISSQRADEKILSDLTELDIQLLGELTRDARTENIDMARNLGIKIVKGTPQKISRRLQFLREKAIKDYRIFLNWEIFDLYQRMVIIGYCSKSQARKIRNYLMIEEMAEIDESVNFIQFPFGSLFFITDFGFYWFIRAPPAQTSEISNFLWEVCPNHHLFLLDYKFSKSYALWPKTFDAENKKWKTSQEFMVNSVLKNMKSL